MSKLIFIRHGPKKYKNNHNPEGMPAHDPPLDCQNRLVVFKASKIFAEHGIPTKIICSPFLRTRQTANIIKNILPVETEIIVDKDVEEFLGFQKPIGGKSDLDLETQKYTDVKLGVENFEKLIKRAENFYNKVKSEGGIILIITHGIFISQLAKSLNINIKHIEELSGIVIENNKVNIL
jgi:broad specificity phosphatase PhoE